MYACMHAYIHIYVYYIYIYIVKAPTCGILGLGIGHRAALLLTGLLFTPNLPTNIIPTNIA